jgi:hypothetical protein
MGHAKRIAAPRQHALARAIIAALLGLAALPAARAQTGAASLCHGAIATAEAQTHIPDAFLSAIGRVESGGGPAGDAPWPWTVNAAGQGHFYATKQAAIAAVQVLQAAGTHSIDVGCLQVNLQAHPEAFASLEQAFDPAANASYAAKFLTELFHQTGNWPAAAAAYHSQTPAIGHAYQQKVLSAWANPDPRLPYPARAGASQPDPAVPNALPAQPMGQAGTDPPAATGFTRIVKQDGPVTARGAIGRSLASYRAMPVRLASRPPPRARDLRH